MGLFDWRKKKKHEQTEDILTSSEADYNYEKHDLEAEYEKEMRDLEAEMKKRSKAISQQLVKDAQMIDRLKQAQYEGSRMSDQIVYEQAKEIETEMEKRRQEARIKRCGKLFNERYFDIIQFSKNKEDNVKFNSLPSDIKHFALIAFYEEEKVRGFLDPGYEIDSQLIEQNCGKQYSDLNKRIILSMGILANLGLLNIINIHTGSLIEPTMFENIIGENDLSEYHGNNLSSIVLSISNAISKQNGKDGLLDEFFSNRLPIEKYSSVFDNFGSSQSAIEEEPDEEFEATLENTKEESQHRRR